MGDQPSRARVSVAVIGVGPNWEQHYRDAVLALSSRICVRAVCDPVHMRAAACADELRARAFSCPWLLAQRNDLHAWLILDPGWFGTYPAELAVQHCRPALLASSFSAGFHEMAGLFRRSLERGESLMPEFSQRFVPATTRLRELVATKLGPVRQIKIEVRRPAEGLHSAIESLQES